jgi:hypothetical protein
MSLNLCTYLSEEPEALEGPEDWVKVEHQRVGVGGVVTGEETHFVFKLNYKSLLFIMVLINLKLRFGLNFLIQKLFLMPFLKVKILFP